MPKPPAGTNRNKRTPQQRTAGPPVPGARTWPSGKQEPDWKRSPLVPRFPAQLREPGHWNSKNCGIGTLWHDSCTYLLEPHRERQSLAGPEQRGHFCSGPKRPKWLQSPRRKKCQGGFPGLEHLRPGRAAVRKLHNRKDLRFTRPSGVAKRYSKIAQCGKIEHPLLTQLTLRRPPRKLRFLFSAATRTLWPWACWTAAGPKMWYPASTLTPFERSLYDGTEGPAGGAWAVPLAKGMGNQPCDATLPSVWCWCFRCCWPV